jgi:hypothetical protein
MAHAPFGPGAKLNAHFITNCRRRNTPAATMLRATAPHRCRIGDANLVETAAKIAFANVSVARREPVKGRSRPR